MIMYGGATISSMIRHHRALAQAVKSRRTEIGFKQTEIELRGGPSTGTLRNIEQAVVWNYTRRTFKDLEDALNWTPGTCELILKRGY